MLPTGIILLWYGAIGNIPAGYVICDGNNGTPDLRNKFIVGAGDTYAVDAVGGAATHTHAFSANAHNHTLAAGAFVQAGLDFNTTTDDKIATGTTDVSSTLPPYHALAYIMKT